MVRSHGKSQALVHPGLRLAVTQGTQQHGDDIVDRLTSLLVVSILVKPSGSHHHHPGGVTNLLVMSDTGFFGKLTCRGKVGVPGFLQRLSFCCYHMDRFDKVGPGDGRFLWRLDLDRNHDRLGCVGFTISQRDFILDGEHAATATHATHATTTAAHAAAAHAAAHAAATHAAATHAAHHATAHQRAHAGHNRKHQVTDRVDTGNHFALRLFRRGDLQHLVIDDIGQALATEHQP